jgi:hypothetical protein
MRQCEYLFPGEIVTVYSSENKNVVHQPILVLSCVINWPVQYEWVLSRSRLPHSLLVHAVPSYPLKGQCHQIRMTLKWGSFKGLS